MDFKAILRTFLKIILPLAFGCLLLWYLYSKMDIGEIWNVIRKEAGELSKKTCVELL